MTSTKAITIEEPICECGVSLEEHETCEYCGTPSHGLVEVEDRDDSVGYFNKVKLCQQCEEQICR